MSRTLRRSRAATRSTASSAAMFIMLRSTTSSASATSIAATGSRAAPPSPRRPTDISSCCGGSAKRRAVSPPSLSTNPARHDEDPHCHRRLGPSSQRRRPHIEIARQGRTEARRRDLLLDARWLPLDAATDLSRPALRAAEPPRDREPDRGGRARRYPYRHRRPDRSLRAKLLHQAPPAVHDQLHDALSGIHLGAAADPGGVELRGAAPISRGGGRHDG